MIRILCLVLCLTVLAPCVSALGETTKVAAYLLRLREEPSSKAKVLDAFPRGTKVTILKKGDDWTKVKVHGKTGYMQSDKLAYAKYKKSGTESEEGTTQTTTETKTQKVNKSFSSGDTMYIQKGIRLNLREKANGASDILGSYRGGTKVTVLKKGSYWSKVEVKGQTGYMANEYLTDEY